MDLVRRIIENKKKQILSNELNKKGNVKNHNETPPNPPNEKPELTEHQKKVLEYQKMIMELIEKLPRLTPICNLSEVWVVAIVWICW
jgi:isopenicillin N synthase-like dioxygenase